METVKTTEPQAARQALGSWLQARRQARCLDQAELSGQIGVGPAVVKAIEEGQKAVPEPLLRQWLEVLDIDPEELMEAVRPFPAYLCSNIMVHTVDGIHFLEDDVSFTLLPNGETLEEIFWDPRLTHVAADGSRLDEIKVVFAGSRPEASGFTFVRQGKPDAWDYLLVSTPDAPRWLSRLLRQGKLAESVDSDQVPAALIRQVRPGLGEIEHVGWVPHTWYNDYSNYARND